VPTPTHVVIVVHENHTTDNYFGLLAAYGANVASGWPISPNPPARDHPHDRRAYFLWLTGRSKTVQHVQFDTAAALPYYAYLALTGTFFENHCSGFGTNSTPNHLLLVGGQSPTLKNPSPLAPPPVWDLPSLPGLCEDNHVSWKCYTGKNGYPAHFYQQLAGSPKVVSNGQFATDAAAGTLPALSMVWHDSPADEHPPANVTVGQNATWQLVDSVVRAGLWADTVFMLTWDDWGGFDDHVATPVVEYTPDNVQLAYGPRVPLVMFGGMVKPGIDSRWNSHASVPKTAIQLLGLPAMGVPRVDADPGLADRVDSALRVAPPPAFGTQPVLPNAPTPAPRPNPPPPPPEAPPIAVPRVNLRGGKTMPPPSDVVLPKQPHPPKNG
jgi:hypothetical protein